MIDPIERSDALDEKLADSDIGPAIIGLTTYGRRNRHLIYVEAALVGVVLVLVAAVGFLGWHDHQGQQRVKRIATTANMAALEAQAAAQKAQEVAALASRNADAIRTTCESLNGSRRDSRELWDLVIQLSAANPPIGQSAAERKRSAGITKLFLIQLDKVTRQRDCTKPNPFADDTTPTTRPK